MSSVSKRLALQNLVDRGQANVFLRPDAPGVFLPRAYRKRASLQLLVGQGDSEKLVLTDHGFSATLSFGGKPAEVFVPWDAVYMVEPTDPWLGVSSRMWSLDAPSRGTSTVFDHVDAIGATVTDIGAYRRHLRGQK